MKPLKILLAVFAILLATEVVFAHPLDVTATCDNGTTVQTFYQNSQLDIQFKNENIERYFLAPLPENYLNLIYLKYAERTENEKVNISMVDTKLNGMTIKTNFLIAGALRQLSFVYDSEATHPWSLLSLAMTNIGGEIHLDFLPVNDQMVLRRISVVEDYFDQNQNKTLTTRLVCQVVN